MKAVRFKDKAYLCNVFLIQVTLAAQDKAPHYTVIVSLDAFRWDYPAMYDTPNLNQMAREGVKATMLPSYPASTFPNHYTLPDNPSGRHPMKQLRCNAEPCPALPK